MAPAAPTPGPIDPGSSPGQTPGAPGAFVRLVETALRERGRLARDARAGLTAGTLEPRSLCRYAAGRGTSAERREVEGVLLQDAWAMDRVSALVRGARTGSEAPLAAGLLAAAREGVLDPYRIVAVALLDALDRADACRSLDREGDSAAEEDALVRAACLLGRRELQQARRAFAKAGPPDQPPARAILAAARRVAELPDDDEALVELLAAV